MSTDLAPRRTGGTNLVDVLDRVLDKGLVIAGDVKISLAEVELLTIRIRLIVCSLDKAAEIGLDWWKYDRHFAVGSSKNSTEVARLEAKVKELERQLAAATRSLSPVAKRNVRAAHVSRKPSEYARDGARGGAGGKPAKTRP